MATEDKHQSTLSISIVHGGFVLHTTTHGAEENFKTEVFSSQGKLMKALRTFIDEHSLVKKTKDDTDSSLD